MPPPKKADETILKLVSWFGLELPHNWLVGFCFHLLVLNFPVSAFPVVQELALIQWIIRLVDVFICRFGANATQREPGFFSLIDDTLKLSLSV